MANIRVGGRRQEELGKREYGIFAVAAMILVFTFSYIIITSSSPPPDLHHLHSADSDFVPLRLLSNAAQRGACNSILRFN